MAINSSTESSSTVFYLRPKEGQLSVYSPTAEDYPETCESVKASFLYVSMVHDEGTPARKGVFGKDPYDALLVCLKDKEKDELYYIKSDINLSFSQNLVAQLMLIEADTEMEISVKPGDKPKVTLVSTKTQNDEGEWKFVSFSGYKGDAKKAEEDIKTHKAYKELPKKGGETESQETKS